MKRNTADGLFTKPSIVGKDLRTLLAFFLLIEISVIFRFILNLLGQSSFGHLCCSYPWTGGPPRQSASEPPVSCLGILEWLPSASAAAVLRSDESQFN